MFNVINRLIVEAQVRRQEGQAMVEYGLILGLVSVVAVAILGTLGGQVEATFTRISTALGAALG